MDREIKAALLAFVGLAVVVVGAVALVRFVVPAVLEAHFLGSVPVAVAVGVAGLVGLVALGWYFIGAVRRVLNGGRLL